MVSSCSFTMCASCWKMEPSSTMVDSMFCMVSARLWIYESYRDKGESVPGAALIPHILSLE